MNFQNESARASIVTVWAIFTQFLVYLALIMGWRTKSDKTILLISP